MTRLLPLLALAWLITAAGAAIATCRVIAHAEREAHAHIE